LFRLFGKFEKVILKNSAFIGSKTQKFINEIYVLFDTLGGVIKMSEDCASDCNVAGDFAEALSKEVETMIKKAADRAKANGRKTITPRDL